MLGSLLSSLVSALENRRALALEKLSLRQQLVALFKNRLITVALCSLTIHCGHEQTTTIDEKPNILFVAVDDMNDWVGFLGGHPGMTIHTPNLDRLAASSMIFTDCTRNSMVIEIRTRLWRSSI